MTDTTQAAAFDYSETLFLPKTDFAMRAELPKREPDMLARWKELGIYERLREKSAEREKFVLHDGPPYANGHLHIGHALNKVLKDFVVRTKQMGGFDAPYVPGWDCHGLPIEWRVEEEYRAAGKNKDEVPVVDFRRECRAYAEKWIGVQSEEFQRLGVVGKWSDPYTTMKFRSEAVIASELMKFAASGQLYRGSKPVMWSIVERTALAEAEVEYAEHTSPTIFVKFPIKHALTSPKSHGNRLIGEVPASEPMKEDEELQRASVVIWTTTPWTIPGNRAIAYSEDIEYSLFLVTQEGLAADNWVQKGDLLVLADELAEKTFSAARVTEFKRLRGVDPEQITFCQHPLHAQGYDFKIPVLPADFVTADTGTGFVHTAPGHGADDYILWIKSQRHIASLGISTAVPHTVQPDGSYFPDVPLFGGTGVRVLDDKGKDGGANDAVMKALIEAGNLLARGRLRHQYPHSWRSKAPLIFRNTPQWFIAMDGALDGGEGDTLRARALNAISDTQFFPPQGENRLRGMIEARPDWVISRQRAWGVPITVFVSKATGEILNDERVNARIREAFEAEGADAWFADESGARFLGNDYSADEYEKVHDILDVWFDSGSTHAFVLEGEPALQTPADMYLEGSDQHRGWFHSSLLESCGTRGQAPYLSLLTHGFVLDEQGRKMSKSLGNTTTPQDVIAKSGADILRLWVAAADYSDDLRIGPEILKTSVDTYRKLRNTLRWMLGALTHFDPARRVDPADMPEAERYILHELWRLEQEVRDGYDVYNFRQSLYALMNFCTNELSAFYFDIRKDTLYCDPLSSHARASSLSVIDLVFDCVVKWLAPLIPFTTDEAWLLRHPDDNGSVHLEDFAAVPDEWRNDELAEKWERIRRVRRVVTGALEIERSNKRIGSSLEAAPIVHVTDVDLRAAFEGVDLAEICITSDAALRQSDGPEDAFRLDDVPGVAVVPAKAEGHKCARSWKITPEVGSDPEFPDITPRDAAAMREWRAAKNAA
ncbi:isoleucine--tRNA ligase [Terrihabitans sp. B22-R8]|uniref:isoleucine--tRNA ligase n=1 Tax=Terrihabitans sp. B22-R8 TaxID=3425128 RepID=UPI00403CDC52